MQTEADKTHVHSAPASHTHSEEKKSEEKSDKEPGSGGPQGLVRKSGRGLMTSALPEENPVC